MRKISMLSLFFIFILFLESSAAVEVTNYNGTFVRDSGTPVTETVNFPGVEGAAVLKVYNAAEDDSFEKVSSSIIEVNGVDIFSQDSFNQNVSYLEKEIQLIEGENIITVELRGKPWGTIRIEILQTIDADAAEFIDVGGGEVKVTDPSSSISGLEVKIPANSVTRPTLFAISISSSGNLPPNSEPNISEIINIQTNSPLKGSAFVRYPLKTNIEEGDSLSALYYNERTFEWESMSIIGIDPDENSVTVFTTHFSESVIQKNEDLVQYVNQPVTNFIYNRDRFHPKALNDTPPGDCAGYSHFSMWYHSNHLTNPSVDQRGLSCRWREEKARIVANKAQAAIRFSADAVIAEKIAHKNTFLHFTDHSVAKEIIEGLNAGNLKSLLMLRADLRWHNIIVYDYEKISDTEIVFLCYDPNEQAPQKVKANKILNKWVMSYWLYVGFSTMDLTEFVHDAYDNIYWDTNSEDWCIDDDNDGVYDNGDGNEIIGDNTCSSGNIYSCDDNCLSEDNPQQTDSNGDGVGDACQSQSGYQISNATINIDGDPSDWSEIDSVVISQEGCNSGECLLGADVKSLKLTKSGNTLYFLFETWTPIDTTGEVGYRLWLDNNKNGQLDGDSEDRQVSAYYLNDHYTVSSQTMDGQPINAEWFAAGSGYWVEGSVDACQLGMVNEFALSAGSHSQTSIDNFDRFPWVDNVDGQGIVDNCEEDFPVYFPDPNLEVLIREHINIPPEDPIMYSDLQQIEYLQGYKNGIESLEGIQYCNNLGIIWLFSQNITDFSPILELKNLTHLHIGQNNINDISWMSALTNIVNLDIHNNGITDLTPLENLATNLEGLGINGNPIEDISVLSKLVNLNRLNAGGLGLTDITPLLDLPLSVLHLKGNPVDLNQVAQITTLQFLSIGDNWAITDLSPISVLINLQSLSFAHNYGNFSDITPLTSLTNLYYLDLQGNAISDIAPLLDNPGIGSGDQINLTCNPLSNESYDVYIPELENKGVTITYDPRPNPPTGLSVKYDPSTDSNYIIWNPVEGLATKYRLYWGTDPGVTVNSEYVGETSNVEFVHTGVVEGYTYYYRVSTVTGLCAEVESKLSNEVFTHVP